MLATYRSNTSSMLASFATLKSLSDEKKYLSPYQILGEFIRYIIISDSIYSFTTIEMKNRLTEHFGFSIPEAVIRSSTKNMAGLTLSSSTYTVTMSEIGTDSMFETKKKEADEYSEGIIRLLCEYISNKTGDAAVDEVNLTHDLINFLIKDQPAATTKYTELISEFILKNEKDQHIQSGLDRIREGSILYIGLSHNINETGSITKPLILYLCTEILFSLVGYNGETYQQFANDFFDQVRFANSAGSRKITLHYFTEVKKEMDEFFKTAEEIVEGKRRYLLDKPAMKAIIDGCTSSADVVVKQSDFYTKLRISFGITEDPHGNYYDEVYFISNLESFDYDSEDDKNKKRETGLRLISHINKLRDGKRFSNDLESECLLVTNAKATLLISKEQTDKIKDEEGLERLSGFAISLDRITSLLWYKLGNGFSSKKFPVGVRAILKARVVLSSNIAKNAERVFNEIKAQYESGEVSEAYVASRIIMLRNKPQLPEDLEGDDIDEIMNFSPEYLSRFEEQYKSNQSSLKEKEELIASLQAETHKKISERDVTIASQEGIITEKENENTALRNALDEYRRKEIESERKKDRRKNIRRFVWNIIWRLFVLTTFTVLAIYLENKCESKIPMYISTVVNTAGLSYTLWAALKKDKEKYLKESDKKEQSL